MHVQLGLLPLPFHFREIHNGLLSLPHTGRTLARCEAVGLLIIAGSIFQFLPGTEQLVLRFHHVGIVLNPREF